MSVLDQYRATALLHLLETTDAGAEFRRSCELGRRYREAQSLSSSYEARSIDWCFAANLDTSSSAILAVDAWWPEHGERPRGSLVLEGGKGCGKTTAAVRLLLRVGGAFVRAGSLHDIPLGETEQIPRMMHAPLLVLDNLGSEEDIGPTLARIHALLVHRDGVQLPTVITTTLVQDFRDRTGRPIPGVQRERSMAGRYQDDVVDRLLSGRWVRCKGDSRRGAAQPDLRDAIRSARRWDAFLAVGEARAGKGDPQGAIEAIRKACGFTADDLQNMIAELSRSTMQVVDEMPDYLRANPVLARYLVQPGVA